MISVVTVCVCVCVCVYACACVHACVRACVCIISCQVSSEGGVNNLQNLTTSTFTCFVYEIYLHVHPVVDMLPGRHFCSAWAVCHTESI